MPLYIKGFAIDHIKVHKLFAPQLKNRVDEAYNAVIEVVQSQDFELVLVRNGPCVIVLASDHDRAKLEATPVEKDSVSWFEQVLEEEARVFETY